MYIWFQIVTLMFCTGLKILALASIFILSNFICFLFKNRLFEHMQNTFTEPCPVGFFLNQTSNLCDQCPAGLYKDVESASTCSSCPKGYTTQVSGSKSESDCVCKYIQCITYTLKYALHLVF
jgi:hypothetical protein